MNNLRITLRFLIYDVLRREHSAEIARHNDHYKQVLRNCGFGVNIRTNQDTSYMRGMDIFLRRRIQGRLRDQFNYIPMQYQYEIFWAFTDNMSLEDKEIILNHARHLHSYLETFMFQYFNLGSNNLNLKFDTYDSRCFIGLYETPVDAIRGEITNPVRQIVNNNRSFLKFKNYTPNGYINSKENFYNLYVDDFLNRTRELEPQFQVRVQNELNTYDESHVIVSPGLSLEAFNVLLNAESEDLYRAIYVSWSTRIGFSVQENLYRYRWLMNQNIANYEEFNHRSLIRQNCGSWRNLLNFVGPNNQ